MIEAVNSVVSNAQQARVATAQAATLNSFAADAQAIESVARAPVAPFISPYISVDANFDTAVLQIRDSDTGDVLTQFPSESSLQLRRAQTVRQETRQLQSQSIETREAPSPSSAPRSTGQTSATTFQAQQVAQASTPPAAAGGEAQAAVAALSAGAQSGQGAVSTVSVTA